MTTVTIADTPIDQDYQKYVRKVARALVEAAKDKYLYQNYSKMGLTKTDYVPPLELTYEKRESGNWLSLRGGNKYVEINVTDMPYEGRLATDMYRIIWLAFNYVEEKM